METFGPSLPPVKNGRFADQRRAALAGLATAEIDEPIAGLIAAVNRREHCFTQQCCFGHFVWPPDRGPHNCTPLPPEDPGVPIEYRIAYVALCLDDGKEGRALLWGLSAVAEADPDYVQFGTAAWFWERQVNSYALQVEPERFRDKDSVTLAFEEARRVELARDRFFAALGRLFG